MKLKVNQESCIKCGKCVTVCPSWIFVKQGKTESVELVNTDSCISCGHCVSVCPTGSVEHSEFPSDRIHSIDYRLMPAPEQMQLLCRSRRSNRAISKKAIPDEMLDMILDAAHRAPTASNSQHRAFTLVTDPEKLRFISDFTIGVFDGVAKKLQHPLLKPILKPILGEVYKYVPVFERLKQEHRDGNDPILRKSTAIILIHTPKANRFGCEDSNLAYQNASLMAESLGVSQIYMGFVLTAVKQENKSTLAKAFGIEGHIHAIMGLGMPSFRYPNYMDRNPIDLTRL